MATSPAILWKWADTTARDAQVVKQLEIGSYGLLQSTGRLFQAVGAGAGSTLWAQVAISTDDPEDLAARIAVVEGLSTKAFYHGSCVAAVEYDGTTWEAASTRITFVDGLAQNITRANATFTYALAGKYLWNATVHFTGDGAALLGVRLRRATTTIATAFGNTIGSTTSLLHLTAIVDATVDGEAHALQVASPGTMNSLPQITIDSQVVANMNMTITKVS